MKVFGERSDQEVMDEFFATNDYAGERPDWREVDPGDDDDDGGEDDEDIDAVYGRLFGG